MKISIDPRALANTKTLLTLFCGVFTVLVSQSCSVVDELRAKTTIGRMGHIILFLEEQDGLCNSDCLRPILEKHDRLDLLTDRWGHPFQITWEGEPENPTYSVRSLGKDGKKGDCCVRWVDDFADDAVLRGHTWLQVWR